MKLSEIEEKQREIEREVADLQEKLELLQEDWRILQTEKPEACLKEFGSHEMDPSGMFHSFCTRCGAFGG